MSTETVTIDKLGAQGDGVASSLDGPVYVPFTLPGETVAIARVKNQGTLMSVTSPSPERQDPKCRHFGPHGANGACGGCSLQHYAGAPYRAFKRQLVVNALRSKGLAPPVDELVASHPGERRRVVFAARRTEKDILIGFNQAESHHIVAIEECPIAARAIVVHLPAIKSVAKALSVNADAFRLTVTETLSGLDLAADGIKALPERQRRSVVETVLGLKGIARVSLDGEILVEPVKPVVDFGGVSVAPPPGAFMQATKQAEEAMAELVLTHVGKAKRVADLFAGAGTFSLRLAYRSRVHAVEADDKALAALDHAARHAQGLKPVTVERRDLFRRPLMAQELKAYDGVVFDPPRAGAEFQCKELGRSAVKTVVAVSCNPTTLARDLAILVEGGYRIVRVTPIDQFLWTSHVEVVAALQK
jgi:23S rRNA (uracil1939-C5)-methyltransferase